MSRVGIYIDATTGNLGIGTTAPRQYLDVQGGDAIVSGNIGIGTTAPIYPLDVRGNINALSLSLFSTINDTYSALTTGNGQFLSIEAYNNTNTVKRPVLLNAYGGSVGIGTTNPLSTLHVNNTIRGADGDTASFLAPTCATNSFNFVLSGHNNVGQKLVMFVNGSTRTTDGGANTTTIRNDGGNLVLGSTSYVTTTYSSSDYRRKKNIEIVTDSLNGLQNINVIRYNYINESDDDIKHIGFFAHEVQQFVPTAVINNKDEIDENGNPVYQGMDNSKLVPYLASCIQDLKRLIDRQDITIQNLQERISQLEQN